MWIDQDNEEEDGLLNAPLTPARSVPERVAQTGPLLSVRDLVTSSASDTGGYGRRPRSFDVGAGETLAIVARRARARAVTALSILRLIPDPPGLHRRRAGSVEGQDLLKLSDAEIRSVRGNRIGDESSQEPMSSSSGIDGWLQWANRSTSTARTPVVARALGMARDLLQPCQDVRPASRIGAYPAPVSAGCGNARNDRDRRSLRATTDASPMSDNGARCDR